MVRINSNFPCRLAFFIVTIDKVNYIDEIGISKKTTGDKKSYDYEKAYIDIREKYKNNKHVTDICMILEGNIHLSDVKVLSVEVGNSFTNHFFSSTAILIPHKVYIYGNKLVEFNVSDRILEDILNSNISINELVQEVSNVLSVKL